MCIKTVYVYSSSTITVCANWGFGLWSTVTSGLTLELVNTLENIVWRTGCFLWNCSDTLCIKHHKTLKLETYAIRLLKLHLCGHLKKKYKQNQSFFFSASTFTIFTINISHFVYKKKHKTKTFFPPLVAVCVYIFVHIITNIQNGCPPSIKKTFKSVTFWLIWFIFDN